MGRSRALGSLMIAIALATNSAVLVLGGALATGSIEPPSWVAARPESNGIRVEWTPVHSNETTVTGYRVYVSDGWNTSTVDVGSNVLSYFDGPLAPNTWRNYNVTTLAGSLESAPSANASATSVEPPGAVPDLSADSAWHTILLNWSAPTSGGAVQGYRIWRGVDPDALSPVATCGCTSFNDTFAPFHATVYYRVQAYNEVNGPLSPLDSAIVLSEPTPPQNLAVQNVAPGSFLISWEPPASNGGSPVDRYDVHRDHGANGTTWLATLNETEHTFLHEGLANATNYSYLVVAFNQWAGTASAPVSGYSGGHPPTPAFVATEVIDAGIVLRWGVGPDHNNATTQFRVYAGDASGALSHAATLPGSSWEWTDAPLAYGVTRYYQVSSIAFDGNESARTDEVNATTYEPPHAPESLHATGELGRIRLTWAHAATGPAPSWYIVYRGTTSSNLAWHASLPATRTEYNDTFVQARVTYWYELRGSNGLEGPASPQASNASLTLPGAPTETLAVGGLREIALSWNAPADDGGAPILGYEVYRGASANATSPFASLGVVTSLTDSGLGNASTWCYRVAARTMAGEGAASAAACGTTDAFPSAPTSLAAAGGFRLVNLSWGAPTNTSGHAVLGYEVYRDAGAGFVHHATLGDVTAYSDTELSHATTYCYRVAARTAVGEGAQSDAACGTTAGPPSAPQNFTVTKTLKTVRLDWEAPASDGGLPRLSYRVYRADDGGPAVLIAEPDPWATMYADWCPLLVTCTYHIAATNAAGEGAATPQRSVVG